MTKRVFKVDILSKSSLEKLKKDLLDYKKELNPKCALITELLAQKGVEVANVKIGESPLGKYISIQTTITPEQAGTRAVIIATGAVKQSEGFADFNTLLAVEFGAGIYHNAVANPKAGEFGLGVGTFPGQIHAFDDGWWYWDEKAQEWRYTHGVKATMPMYSASAEIISSVVAVARSVFG